MAKHRGVSIVQTERDGWVAKWADPITGRRRQCALDRLGLTTMRQREAWAKRMLAELVERRRDSEAGPPPMGVPEALERFFEGHHDTRPKTLEYYRTGGRWLEAWAKARRLRYVQDLSPARVADLRGWLVSQPKQLTSKKAKRGTKHDGGRPSRATQNSRLRAARAILNAWRRLGLTPAVNRDDLADRLRNVAEDWSPPEILTPEQLRTLLEQLEGDTLRDLVCVALLSGCRLGELLSLPWSQVDLDAHPGGCFTVSATASKTRQHRTVDLEPSPALREILRRRRPRKAVGAVFGALAPWSRSKVDSRRKRLIDGGATPWTWHALRRTCGTYLVCSAGIWGGAAVYRAARQLGHSVAVAEKHYLGVVRGVDPQASTLEGALGLEEVLLG